MGHWEPDFVEPAARFKHVAADREKGAGHGADRAGYLPSSARPGTPTGLIASVMERQPLPVEKDAGVLNAVVGIEKTRADSADLTAIEQAAQLPVPAVAQHQHVVIGEHQELRLGHRDAMVVQSGPVEGLVDRNNLHSFLSLQLIEDLRSFGSAAAVVDDQNLHGFRYSGVVAETLNEVAEVPGIVARRDDYLNGLVGVAGLPRDRKLRCRIVRRPDPHSVAETGGGEMGSHCCRMSDPRVCRALAILTGFRRNGVGDGSG